MSKDNPSAVDVTLERLRSKKIEEGILDRMIDKKYNQDNWDNPVFRERYMKAEYYWNTRDEKQRKD